MKKILLLLILPIYLMSYDFANNREVQRFMDEMHQKHNFNKEYLLDIQIGSIPKVCPLSLHRTQTLLSKRCELG